MGDVRHCQNTFSASGNVQGDCCAGSWKGDRLFFTELAAVELSPGWESIDEDCFVDVQSKTPRGITSLMFNQKHFYRNLNRVIHTIFPDDRCAAEIRTCYIGHDITDARPRESLPMR
jgi:hypothetical protein